MNLHLQEFFKNKELNHLYLSLSIMAFAEGLISIFIPIYLFKQGFQIHLILLFYLIFSVYDVILSYPFAKLVSKIGAKHAILLSTPFLILFYLGLGIIRSYYWLFFVLPLLLACKNIFFNYGYAINYINHSTKKNRGKEISLITTFTTLSHILSPLIGGLIAFYFSFSYLYIIGSIILVVSTVPLFLTKDGSKKINFSFKNICKGVVSKKERGILFSFSGYAIESTVNSIIWPIFLITILLNTYKTGLVITLSLIFSIIIFNIVGYLTDKYEKIKLIEIGTILYVIAWVARIFSNSFLRIFLVDSYKNTIGKSLHIPWQAKIYEIATKRGFFKFIIAREMILKGSRIIFLPILMFIFYMNIYPYVISFVLAAIFSICYIFVKEN